MKQVKDGTIVAQRLPKSGIIKGATVMNYHKLPQKTLIAEGWLPVEEVKPDHNVKTERLRLDSEVIEKDKIVRTYLVEAIPAPSEEKWLSVEELEQKLQPEIDILRAELDAVKSELIEKELIGDTKDSR